MCGLGQRTRPSWHAVSHAKAKHPQIGVSHHKTQEGNNVDAQGGLLSYWSAEISNLQILGERDNRDEYLVKILF